MKRDRIAEAEKLLADAEASLRGMLGEVLAAENGASVLVNSEFRPVGIPRSKIWAKAEAFYQNASTCLKMREALGLPTEGSVGALFIAACAENASSEAHRQGPRRLAAALAERLLSET